jgi:ketosteroid isomerase-like protein
MTDRSFEEVVQVHHQALHAFMAGDTQPFKDLFSRADDATLANPFGGIAHGWSEMSERVDGAAANYHEGSVDSIETISTFSDGDLGYTLEIEWLRSKVGDREQVDTVGLRTTCVFRRENGVWKLLHRHADPAVERRAPESIVTTEARG